MTKLIRGNPLFAGLLLFPLQAAAAELPAGEGRDLVEGSCMACHDARLIERSLGYSAEDWKKLSSTMIYLDGAPELDALAAYLAEHFPPDDKRAPVVVDGPLRLSFESWSGPTRGQRARDPVEAPDGSIWWTGQWADLVTRLDPETGATREYDLPGGARAHTVTAAEDGTIWYTGNGNGTMGSLDPESGEITEYQMPIRPPAIRIRPSWHRTGASISPFSAATGWAVSTRPRARSRW